MKHISLLLTIFLIIGCGSSSNTQTGSNLTTVSEDGGTSINNTHLDQSLQSDSSELTQEEEEDLLVLREEEKLAYDVYMTLYGTYGQNIFTNIASAEQTHTDAVLSLIQHYGLHDPVGNNTIGVFENAMLQNLYDMLVTKGNNSLVDAYIVGATVEDLDIQDIEEMKSRTNNEKILLVYESLQKGSRNHLRSFIKQLDALDTTYTPQYISQEMYDSIITSDIEQGN